MTNEEFLRSKGWLPAVEVYQSKAGNFAKWLEENGTKYWISPHPMYFTVDMAVNEELRLTSGYLLPNPVDLTIKSV